MWSQIWTAVAYYAALAGRFGLEVVTAINPHVWGYAAVGVVCFVVGCHGCK